MLVPEIIKKINSDKVVIKYGDDYVLLSHAPAREMVIRNTQRHLGFCVMKTAR